MSELCRTTPKIHLEKTEQLVANVKAAVNDLRLFEQTSGISSGNFVKHPDMAKSQVWIEKSQAVQIAQFALANAVTEMSDDGSLARVKEMYDAETRGRP